MSGGPSARTPGSGTGACGSQPSSPMSSCCAMTRWPLLPSGSGGAAARLGWTGLTAAARREAPKRGRHSRRRMRHSWHPAMPWPSPLWVPCGGSTAAAPSWRRRAQCHCLPAQPTAPRPGSRCTAANASSQCMQHRRCCSRRASQTAGATCASSVLLLRWQASRAPRRRQREAAVRQWALWCLSSPAGSSWRRVLGSWSKTCRIPAVGGPRGGWAGVWQATAGAMVVGSRAWRKRATCQVAAGYNMLQAAWRRPSLERSPNAPWFLLIPPRRHAAGAAAGGHDGGEAVWTLRPARLALPLPALLLAPAAAAPHRVAGSRAAAAGPCGRLQRTGGAYS